MRKFLYLLCGLMFLQSAWAFDATVFPTLAGLSRTVCNEFSSDGCAGTSPRTITIQPNKEVTINGKQYLEFTGNIYLREADNKVYLYSGQGETDLVLYDYTLQVGDQLKLIWRNPDNTFSYRSAEGDEEAVTVTKVEPVTLSDGKEYKKWTLSSSTGTMEYVETIGMHGDDAWSGNYFLLIQEPIPVCLIGTHLVCVSRDEQPLYEMPQEKQEQLHTYCMSVPSADTYFPEGKVWSYLITPLCSEEKAYIQQTKVSGKKTINGKQYVLINDNTPIREDGKKVFVYYDDKDLLIYDFGLEVGDKINYYTMGDFPEEATVTAVDYITLLDGRQAKRIQYDDRATDIEYIGSISDVGILAPLDGYVLEPCGPIDFLCCSYNGQPLYETSEGSCDNIDAAIEQVDTTPQAMKYLHDGQLFLQVGEQAYDVLGRPVSR